MRRTTAVLLWVLTLAASAAAQDFPSKPVRLVVPFPPGGPLDIAGRLIGKELQDRWEHPVIVENKPGSTIGPEYVVKSAPDGYTLMIISSTPLVTLPHLQKVPYDVLKEDRKSTRLNSSHVSISYAVFCLKKKRINCLGSIPPHGRDALASRRWPACDLRPDKLHLLRVALHLGQHHLHFVLPRHRLPAPTS